MILTLFFLIAISIIGYTLIYGIGPVPCSKKAVKVILQAIPKDVKGDIFELGSGFGGLAYALSSRFIKCQIVGFEISIFPFLFSKFLYFFKKNLQFFWKDFYKNSLNSASIIVCYLYPGAMTRLQKKFENELNEGTWVISYTFAIPNWKPLYIYQLNDLYRSKVYVYCFSKVVEE